MEDIFDRAEIQKTDHVYRPVKVCDRVPDSSGAYFVFTEPYGVYSIATRRQIINNPERYISWLEIIPRSLI